MSFKYKSKRENSITCMCPSCGYKIPKKRNRSCARTYCPKCNTRMMIKGILT